MKNGGYTIVTIAQNSFGDKYALGFGELEAQQWVVWHTDGKGSFWGGQYFWKMSGCAEYFEEVTDR